MIMSKKPKIGVYICHCGGNISDTVDVEKVKEAIAKLDGVEIAETDEYVCSSPGQDMIKNGIKDHNLNRIIVASCSPRMHLETFKRTVSEAGLNRYLFEMVNIREQDSWVHDNVVQSHLDNRPPPASLWRPQNPVHRSIPTKHLDHRA